MVCCTLIAALLGLLLWPVMALRANPLGWRLHPAPVVPSAPLRARSRWTSFTYAFAGLHFVLRNEPNMRVHLGAAAIVVLAGLWFRIEISEWRWLVLAVAFVVTCEALNTAVEQACNALTQEYHPAIKASKDVAAAAVLISTLFAVFIGATIFGPRLTTFAGLPSANVFFPLCGGSR